MSGPRPLLTLFIDSSAAVVPVYLVSHTTDDLVFIWLPEDKTPLAVDTGIELPQLELISNVTGDCTSVYSTGQRDRIMTFGIS